MVDSPAVRINDKIKKLNVIKVTLLRLKYSFLKVTFDEQPADTNFTASAIRYEMSLNITPRHSVAEEVETDRKGKRAARKEKKKKPNSITQLMLNCEPV